jgi:uncharacterized protein YprB with RNaseH-like and TPR domain
MVDLVEKYYQTKGKLMIDTVFEDCLEHFQRKDKKSYWNELKDKYGYSSVEKMRSAFRREKSRRLIPEVAPIFNKDSPRVAIFDIETLPAVTYTWQLYDQNIGVEQVIQEISLCSWAAKFLNEAIIYSDCLSVSEALTRDEERITRSCWKFLSGVDVLVGHNITNFDNKLMNTFFLKYNLPPLKYILVDTLVIAKANFRFSSNKLTFINRILGIRDKISNEGFPLWKKCCEGDQESLDIMLNYNIGDIYSTEGLFYRFRPYIKNLNVSLYNEIEEMQCPVCGSKNLNIEGFYYTGNAGKYESVRCLDCNCISRKKENLLTKEKRKGLLINS